MGIFSISVNKLKLLISIFITLALSLWFFDFVKFICPIKSITSLDCAMCRSTRAIELLMEYHFVDSFKMNPMALIWLYFISLSYIKLIFESFNIEILKDLYNFKYSITKYVFNTLIIINIFYLNLF